MAASTTPMTNRADAAKAPAAEKAPAAANEAQAAAAPASGGIKQFLPIIANVILMPVLAYAMTAFVLVPKLAKKSSGESAATAEKSGGHESAESSHSSGGEAAESKDALTGKA